MKIAVCCQNGRDVSAHPGKCTRFVLVDSRGLAEPQLLLLPVSAMLAAMFCWPQVAGWAWRKGWPQPASRWRKRRSATRCWRWLPGWPGSASLLRCRVSSCAIHWIKTLDRKETSCGISPGY